jgi:predicted dehydrogenase
MINVGMVGIGFMGWIHWLAYQKVRGAKVVAICETEKKKLSGDWRGIKGNFGPPGEKVDLTGIDVHTQIERMIADPKIDLIDICLPPSMHVAAALKALRAGKHVFCEKPLALTPADCNKLVKAAERADRQLMVGHVLPLFPEYAFARRAIDSGKYGRLLGGSFKRVISDPLWLKDFYDPKRIGGPMLDLHIHDAHFIRLLFGMPTSLISQGRMRGRVVEYFNTLFNFSDPKLVVSATSGVINQQGRGFTHGFEIHLEKATLHYELAIVKDESRLMPLTVLTDKGRAVVAKIGDGDPVNAFEAEIKEVVRAVRTGEPSALLSGDLARDAIVICHRETESVIKRRQVRV